MARNWNSTALTQVRRRFEAAGGVSVASSTIQRIRSECMPWMLATAFEVAPSSTATAKMAFLSSPFVACRVVLESTMLPTNWLLALFHSCWTLAQARLRIILAVVDVSITELCCGSDSHQTSAYRDDP